MIRHICTAAASIAFFRWWYTCLHLFAWTIVTHEFAIWSVTIVKIGSYSTKIAIVTDDSGYWSVTIGLCLWWCRCLLQCKGIVRNFGSMARKLQVLMCAPIMLMCFSHRRYVKMAKRRTTLSGIQISCDVTDTGQWDRYTFWAVFVYVCVRRFLTCALQHTVTEVVKIDEETRTRFGAFLRTCDILTTL